MATLATRFRNCQDLHIGIPLWELPAFPHWCHIHVDGVRQHQAALPEQSAWEEYGEVVGSGLSLVGRSRMHPETPGTDRSLGHRWLARVPAQPARPSGRPSPPPTFHRPLRSLLPRIPDGAKESLGRHPHHPSRTGPRSGGGAAPSCARIPPPRAPPSFPPSLPATAPRERAAHAERPRPRPRPAPRPGVPGRAAGRRTMQRRCRSGGGRRRRR